MNVLFKGPWKPKWAVHDLAQIEHLRTIDMLGMKGLLGHGVYLFTRRFVSSTSNIRTESSFNAWIGCQLSLSSGELESGMKPTSPAYEHHQ